MAMNLDAVLRIAAKVVGLEDLGALQRGLVGAEKAAGEAKSAFGAVVNSASWQAAAAAAAGFGVAIGLSAKAAIDFESSMADVRKVVDGLETPAAINEIKAEIIDLSRQMPITARGFAEIYAAAGASGIAKGELKDFAVTVAQVAVAFDMTAQEAGQSLAQLRVSLGLTTPQLGELADAMNYLDNNTGASARNLVDFMSRAAATGKIAGLTGQQTAAFGAAMIQTGIQSEVAATSFNNMIKALSKGPSMTERQVDALRRLGYSMVDAGQVEQQLTRVAETESRRRLDVARQQGNETVRVAEEQSRRRIEVAREETSQLSREISRRYRDQLQALQDGWDDEASAREEALQDQADAQIRAIQQQQEAQIKAAQDRARAANADASAQVNAIRDAYDQQIDAIRDQLNRQLTVERRASRDRQQVVRDRLQDQERLESQAVEQRLKATEDAEDRRLAAVKAAADRRFKAIEETEKAALDAAKASAKKTGEELAAQAAQGFSDRLQQNAVGTITEVLGKIAALPKAKQVSVLSDLFGDEARGLAPLLANLGELERILGLAGNKAAYTGSVLKEFQVRSETAANKIQLFQNNLTALQIEVGDTVLPALVKLADAFGPIIKGVADFAAANPGLTTALVAIGGILSALVIAAPGILATITLLGQLKLAIVGLNLGGLIAGWLPAIVGFVAQLGALFVIASQGIILGLQVATAWISGTFVPALLALFSGPVGWTVLAIAAVVGMAIAFRDPLMKFAAWLWAWGEPIRKFWVDLWNGAKKAVADGFAYIDGIIAQVDKNIQDSINQTWQAITKGFETYVTIPLASAWNKITRAFNDNLVTPIRNAWTALTTLLPQVLKNAFRGVLQFIADRVNQVGGLINQLVDGYNNLPNFGDIPRVPTLTVPAFAEGGTVSRPTLAMVGDGGEREYIVPESKMAAASARFLSGQRGAAVIPSGSSGRSGGAASSPVVNISTGPVMQQADGSRWVSLDDLERASQQTAEQILAMLRSPQGRMALMG
jgi:hypothetical protein